MNDEDFEQQPTEQPEQQPPDPFAAATDALMYGDETAPEKLRVAINAEANARDRWKALQDETRRTTEIVNRFRAENPDIDGDEDLRAATESCLVREQRDDLLKLGLVDEAKLGRALTRHEITDLHQQARVLGHAVRSPETLLEHARDTITEKFGLRTRPEALQAQRSATVLDRINRQREALGRLPYAPLPSHEEQPQDYHAATETTPTEMTKTGFGGDVVEGPNRARGFAQVAKGRTIGRGRTFYAPEE
jgi:hypothetical protein